MPTTQYTASSTSDDYDSIGDGSSSPYVLEATWNNTLGTVRSTIQFKPDTSGLPTGAVVTGLRLRVYEYSYGASRGVAKTYRVYIKDSGGTSQASTGTFTYGGLGVAIWLTLPSSFYAWVYDDQKSWLAIDVDNPGAAKYRQFRVQDSSYGSTREMVLEVTYTEPVTGRTYVMMIGA